VLLPAYDGILQKYTVLE